MSNTWAAPTVGGVVVISIVQCVDRDTNLKRIGEGGGGGGEG